MGAANSGCLLGESVCLYLFLHRGLTSCAAGGGSPHIVPAVTAHPQACPRNKHLSSNFQLRSEVK